MLPSKPRAFSNLFMLERVARKLAELNNEVVYLGGCATALYVDEPQAFDVRATLDVDCIVDIISLKHFHQFEKKLTHQGFKKSPHDEVICRWHYQEIILDVMPTDEKILGFTNSWYKQAIQYPIKHRLADDLEINAIAAPFFLATKYEAFKTRGQSDYLGSHDFEDIITVIAGRRDIVKEVQESPQELKSHLREVFQKMLGEEAFLQALPGHLNDGPMIVERLQIVIDRIKAITY